MRRFTGILALATIAACTRQAEQNAAENQVTPPIAGLASANESTSAPEPGDRTPLSEPHGAIDPNSAEAAGQVVQHYGALMEQRRWKEAATYWGDSAAAAAFENQLQARSLKHVEISKPGEPEGAAGSIYVTMPVFFYEGSKREPADIILRRVNDVPGSTEAQRRWHIERIEWKT